MHRARTGQTYAWLDPALCAGHSARAVLTLKLSGRDGEPREHEHEWSSGSCCSALCRSPEMAGKMFVYDNTEPTRPLLAEEAEPVYPY
jgi:hypothetical protein